MFTPLARYYQQVIKGVSGIILGEIIAKSPYEVRPVHLLRVSLLRVLESNFPADPLYNYMDMIVPTP